MTLRCKLFGHRYIIYLHDNEITPKLGETITLDYCRRCGIANPDFKPISIHKTETLDIPIEKVHTPKEEKMRNKSDIMKEATRCSKQTELFCELLLDIRDQLVELNKERI